MQIFYQKNDIFIKNVLKNLFIRTIFSNFAQNLNHMNAQKDFERNVKIACRKKKISQKELAKELGVSYVTISRLESSKVKPSFLTEKRLENFCKEKGIKTDHIQF